MKNFQTLPKISGAFFYLSDDNLDKIRIMKVQRGGGYRYKLIYSCRDNINTPFYVYQSYERASAKNISKVFNAILKIINNQRQC